MSAQIACPGWGVARVARGRDPRSTAYVDDPASTGPITVTDLLAKAGQSPERSPGRRIAARQAVATKSRHRVRRFFAVLLTLLLALLASAAAYFVGLFFYLDRTIERVEALDVDSPAIISAQAQEQSDTFLIVGTREVGSDMSLASALIAHLDPDRGGAVLVSLPLTAWIDVPACPADGESQLQDPYGGALASSYETGGAGCLVRSVQQLSGIRIDHYVELDLGGLPGMVESLGGVPVCLPAAVTDAQLSVPAGNSVLDTDQVRALLAGLDTDQDPTGQVTTDRQRLLLASTLREAVRVPNLANPIVLTGFIGAAANALTLDPTTTLGELKELGGRLDQFTADDTVQTSVPLSELAYQPTGSDETYALIDDTASRGIFSAIIGNADVPVPGQTTSEAAAQSSTDDAATAPGQPSPDPGAAPAPPPDPNALTVPPQQITVNVFNGIGTPGLASDAAAGLTERGFTVGLIENQITGDRESVVRYPPELLPAARTVAAAVPNSVLQEGATTDGAIDLIVGSSFEAVILVDIPGPPPPATPLPSETATSTTSAPTPVQRQVCG